MFLINGKIGNESVAYYYNGIQHSFKNVLTCKNIGWILSKIDYEFTLKVYTECFHEVQNQEEVIYHHRN